MRHLLTSLVCFSFVLGACTAAPEADPNATVAIARCSYVNGFSGNFECKEYLGSNWTDEAIMDNCESPVPGTDPGLVEWGLSCDRSELLGICEVDLGTVEASNIIFPGSDSAECGGLQVGCNFAGGEYKPAETCGGEDLIDLPPQTDREPFKPFELICSEPQPGEPAGNGPDGEVCTWDSISASTEEGRRFSDYVSCEPVYVQRPYWAAAVEANTPDDDPRYSDPEWNEEYEWVTGQVEASACVCCHSTVDAPEAGTSGWFLEADGIWTDTLDDDGMAMMAGWVDSTAFGAFPPEENNGFGRDLTGMPSTDQPRMEAFWAGELARRGLNREDFAETPAFGGPLADQIVYQPERCDEGVGVSADGTVQWTGGAARYVYVMRADAANPGVPPNLDLPENTLWRVDVAHTDDPISTGIQYGQIPDGAFQYFPQMAMDPQPLQKGFAYYLYVLQDIYAPLTRCTFVAQ
ncbi:MAG: proteinase inhibitor [Deltaproteobacteria bacterium]|nr:proteinase inhibitor [Deltaproteobacteria bacterium]